MNNLSPKLTELLIRSANNSLSSSTWANYTTVRRHLVRCQKAEGVRFSFPMKTEQILVFIGFLLEARKVSGKSVGKYLSALRTLHLVEGFPEPMLRPAIVCAVLKGREHYDEEIRRLNPSKPRLPVTLDVLRLLKLTLTLSDLPEKKIALIWAVAIIGFNGAFRIGELLAKESRKIDPLNTLLRGDIYLTTKSVKTEQNNWRKVECICVRLKSSKESRVETRGIIVEVFSNGSDFCPVKSYRRYMGLTRGGKQTSAAFRLPSGLAYCHKEFNKDLEKLLSPYLGNYGKISGHSFRSGIATLMAQSGYTDDAIQAMGRWSSQSFKLYIKLPRITRVAVASRLGGMMK